MKIGKKSPVNLWAKDKQFIQRRKENERNTALPFLL